MLRLKNKFKKSHLHLAGILVIFLLALLLLWYGNATSMQSDSALVAGVYFDGEYRIEDGEWQPIVEGEHIPSTKGDVTLRGNFHMLTPYGEYIGVYTGGMEPIAFYTNHINLTFYEAGFEPWVIDVENPMYGDSVCCACWSAYSLMGESESPIEIRIHNPHNFGNEDAIDEMLRGVAIWGDMSFEKGILNSGEPQRNSGMLLILFAIVFLGIALFSSLIHIKNSKIIWLLGLVVLFAGLYLTYSADGVAFWSESTVSNTTILGSSMIFYMLFLSMIVVCILKQTSAAASVTVQITAVIDAVLFIIPIVSDIHFYDMWGWWAVAQICAGISLAVCLVTEFSVTKGVWRWLYIGAILPFVAFIIDVISTCIGTWSGGRASKYVFIALFAIAAVMVLRFIPRNINAATKARELEMEKTMLHAQLAESRISTMMSQIRPHFIYNTLGSIEQLCKLDPPKAGDLVHNFAKYLRGNFGELDNPKPILMSQEMEHVHHYISIENVRFPDMTFTFEMNSDDFRIPALTVQPIVENAIKHGLMKLSKGGSISVVSYETDTEYRISVVDDGVGFDTGALMDERKHVGLRNIRERLKVMVNGTLEIESTIGEGTKVLIRIPKEDRE